MKRIKEKIGAWLLEPQNTRTVLAEYLGMTRPTLNSRINGETDWTWGEILKIAELCDCAPNDLTD